MANIFSQVEKTKLGSSTFNLSHERKFSMKFGELTPILLLPTIPGDTISLGVTQMLRFAPTLAPVMHRFNVYTHYFFVPHRITWKGWEKFLTSPDSDDVLPPNPVEIPQMQIVPADPSNRQFRVTTGSLMDYLGLPDSTNWDSDVPLNVSILPLLAYQRVYKDYYRDQNLIPPADVDSNPDYWFNRSLWPLAEQYSGLLPDLSQVGSLRDFLTTMRIRAWQHDYFTSALPFAQKGDPVTIPLGTTAPIVYNASGVGSQVRDASTGNLVTGTHGLTEISGILNTDDLPSPGNSLPSDLDVTNSHEVDLENATAASIEDLRTAFSLQKFLERNARAGNRYFEWIQAHLGVYVSDGLIDRPEYLGGGANPVVISEVLQTSSTDATTPQANMAGHGISAGKGATFNYYCKEHGYIVGIMSVMPKTAYQQGVPREWTKFDQFDFFTPEFQNIGEQPIYNKELYAFGNTADEGIFGYVPRYVEYKYIPSTVHGEFKTTLDFWHAGRIFSALPSLNKDFIEMDALEVSRIFAVTESEQLYVYLNHSIKARRKMQYFGSPGITRM